VLWLLADRRQAAISAPLCRDLHRPDSRVIERPGWFQVITPSTRSAHLNEVMLSQVETALAEATIDETIAVYRKYRLPIKWCVGPRTAPEDMGERLRRRGFQPWDVRGMGCDPAACELATPDEVTVEAVDEWNLPVFVDTMASGWSLADDQKEPTAGQFRSALRAEPRTVHLYLARIGARPVGTAGLILRKDYAYLIGSQIEPAARGRGLYRALIEARLRFLRERGVALAVTQAREKTSAPMLEHLGFETLFRSQCWLLE
jgi:GNAT superfamily N-acetyltransferase